MTIEYKDSKRITTSSNEYKVHSFTTTGNSTFAVTGSGDVEYLVIGGGGGGGYNQAGGGGAGGYRTGTGFAVTAQNYTITVGAGGAGSSSGNGTVGNDSVFSTITSDGGGYGATNTNTGGSGGSGGGAGAGGTGGSATSGQGNDGGSGITNVNGGGGGGSSSTETTPTGGLGTSSSITGSAVSRAGGGGGGNGQGSGSGGSGTSGGGNGGYNSNGTAGTVNTGSGGGGGGNSGSAAYSGGAGGSGIVIIRYLTSSGITATGGTITTVTEEQSKPTDVQDNSLLVEKDTANRYWVTAQTSVDTEDVYDEITGRTDVSVFITKESPNWSNGEGRYLGLEINDNAGGQALVGKGVKKIKVRLYRGTALTGTYRVGIMDSSGTVKGYSDHDASEVTGSSATYSHTMNNAVILAVGDIIFISYTATTNPLYLRTNNITNGFGSNYSGAFSPRSVTTGTTWVTSLDGDASRLWMFDFDFAPATDQIVTPATWTMQPTYEDDLSTDKGWVSSYSTKMAYNGTTDKLDLNFENELNNANITIVKELDFTLGTKFVVRFVLDFSQFGGVPFITMGVSDKDSTVNADTAQDYLGIVCHNGSTWSAQVKDNTELGTFTNINQASYSGHQSGFGTDFYCELIRNENSFTINIRTGSHTGTSVVTATTTISTIGTVSNLKYIKFGNYDGTSSGGYCATTIDDLLVYNGVTSPSSTPSKSWKEIGT